MVGWKQCQGLHVFTANPIKGALFLPKGLELKHPFHQPSRGISQRPPASILQEDTEHKYVLPSMLKGKNISGILITKIELRK